jgi:hypothetical protein
MTRPCQARSCDLVALVGPHRELLSCAVLALGEAVQDFIDALRGDQP